MIEKNDNPVLIEFPNLRSNVFLMTRFRDTPQHREIADSLFSVLAEYSLNPIQADAKQWRPELWANVRACMDASLYGIAVFEQIDERDINANVMLELGYMLGQGKRCLLLKEKRATGLPIDLHGHLYREFDSYNIKKTVTAAVQDWLQELGIAKKPGERMVAYVSQGGTCRCAMAKTISRRLLLQNDPGYSLRFESMAYGHPTLPGASEGARRAIEEIFGEDLLADHRTVMLTPTRMREADLILVMDHRLLKGLPPEKSHALKPYFGLEGDILDPWPDHDAGALERYRRCAAELHSILASNIHKIVEALRP